MKKNWKIFGLLSLGLVLIALGVFVGCGKDTGNSGGSVNLPILNP